MEPFLDLLAERGYDVKVLGVAYDGREHEHLYTVVPVGWQDAYPTTSYVAQVWEPDYFLVALDLPLHTQMIRFADMMKYIGVFPIESGPLPSPSEWTVAIDQMYAAFGISENTVRQCHDVGLDKVRLLPAGIKEALKAPPNAREFARGEMMIDDNAFVVLTIADNHERKNLSAHYEAIAELVKLGVENVRYFVVTKERPDKVGWRLARLERQHDLIRVCTTFEGSDDEMTLPDKTLADLYAASDAFLLLSNAEGLGMPVLEAMINDVPVVGTNCCATADHLAEGRGYPVKVEFKWQGPFLNGYKYFADPIDAAKQLQLIYRDRKRCDEVVSRARAYAEKWTFERMFSVFQEMLDGKKQKEESKQEAAATEKASAIAPIGPKVAISGRAAPPED